MSDLGASTRTLAPGTRLSHYEIVSLLGAGGMGAVYRARDGRLSRDVALKVLPGNVADDSGRFRRFQTEAKAAAALSHPHIVAIHDVGEEGGIAYIVSELVPGGTLTALLEHGPLSTRRILDLAVSLADALDAAHASGIVHRDLKPDNILIAKDGSAKIADFGLAKYLAPVPADGDTAGTTLADERTREGAIVGTVGYMSPEQANGKILDFRSDQFSLGSVLYEMATGTRAFRRNTAVDTLAAILHDEPEAISRANPRLPIPLRWTIARCLAKDPEGRYASTADLARELATIREHLGEATDSGPAASGPRWHGLGLGLAAAALLGAGLLTGRLLRPPVPAQPSFQQLTFRRGNLLHARYTPDGGSIIYSAAWEGNPPEIYTARLDGTESHPFGVLNADVLSVSSTGELAVLLHKSLPRNLGGRGTLALVPLAGGVPRQLLEDVYLADWSADGKQLAVARKQGLETIIEYPIGHALYTTTKSAWLALRVSPSGRRIAFVETGETTDAFDLRLVEGSGTTSTLLHVVAPEALSGIVWNGDREILAGVVKTELRGGESGRIVAVGMTGRARTVFNAPIATFVHDAQSDGSLLVDQEKGSNDLIFGSSSEPSGRNLGWLTGSTFDDMSEDGKVLLFHDSIFTYLRSTDGSPAMRLANGTAGTLSPDGRFVVLRASEHEIGIVPTGPGPIRTVSSGDLVLEGHPRVLSDGRRILFGAAGPDGKDRLYVTDVSGAKPRVISGPIEGLGWTVPSPDEKEIAVSDPVSGLQIFRLDGAPPRKISGLHPDDGVYAWSSDGKFLYVARDGEIPLRIEKFDFATGRKELWRALTPPDVAGVYWAGAPRYRGTVGSGPIR